MLRPLMLSLLLPALLTGCHPDSNDSSNDDTVLVYQSRQAVQCEHNGISPDQSASTLIESGVDVLTSECGFITGKVVPAVCGGESLDIVVHRLHASSLESAEELGFSDTAALIDSDAGTDYYLTDCYPESGLQRFLQESQQQTVSF